MEVAMPHSGSQARAIALTIWGSINEERSRSATAPFEGSVRVQRSTTRGEREPQEILATLFPSDVPFQAAKATSPVPCWYFSMSNSSLRVFRYGSNPR
jgi:hypothetical protein